MAFGVDVDTLSLTFDKLQYIFSGYGQIRDSFLETNTTYMQGKITDREFFYNVQEAVMRFSALEFLALKAVFEIKKSLDRATRTDRAGNVANAASKQESFPKSHSLASFVVAGTLPRPHDVASSTGQEKKNCLHCGILIKTGSSFCTNCGNKM